MKIGLSSETTIDLTKSLLERFNIHLVPFTVILGNENKFDGDIDNKEIFEYVSKNNILPKTSAVNEFQYKEHFTKLLNEYDAIIHVAFSSDLSSACKNAINTSEKYFKDKVYVIDSKSLSTGIALLTIYARELIDLNLPINEIVDKVNNRVNEVQASFVLENVNYLYKGGRCSAMAVLGANLFHIRPQIKVENGKMDGGKKYRGNFYNCVNNYVDDTLNEFSNPDLNNIFITYTDLDDDRIIPSVREKLIKRGFKNIFETIAGGTISSHCGPNTIGILYFNKK